MDYRDIDYQPGAVARIILTRPEYKNAQSRRMIEEMDDAFRRAAVDEDVRVLVLSGEGEHFSSGHDLGTPEEMEDRAVRGYPTDVTDRYPRSRGLYLEATMRWRNFPKPTISMVRGYCIFGGYMFATSMDLIFSSKNALFLPSHLQYFSAPWDCSIRKAKEILYESRFIPAKEAHELGIVNRLYDNDELEYETLAYAGRVAENSSFGNRMIKFSVNHAQDEMGFTRALEAAYQTYYINSLGDRNRDFTDRPKRLGGVARALQLQEQGVGVQVD